MALGEDVLDELDLSASDSEPEDYLWVARRGCRQSRGQSGDPLKLTQQLLPRPKSQRTTLHSQAQTRSRSAPPPSLPSHHHHHTRLMSFLPP